MSADLAPLVAAGICLLVPAATVVAAVVDSKPKPQPRTRAVHSGRKSGRTAVQR